MRRERDADERNVRVQCNQTWEPYVVVQQWVCVGNETVNERGNGNGNEEVGR